MMIFYNRLSLLSCQVEDESAYWIAQLRKSSKARTTGSRNPAVLAHSILPAIYLSGHNEL